MMEEEEDEWQQQQYTYIKTRMEIYPPKKGFLNEGRIIEVINVKSSSMFCLFVCLL
jgi:hypothetical protein